MIVQILKEYGKRTEYKVLEKFVTIQEINIDSLSKGILLLPGILLGKLEEKDIKKINQWLSLYNNQLILTPAWNEVNLKDFFDMSLDIEVIKGKDLNYKGIECQYKIQGKIQEKLFASDKGYFCIHYRRDTGSGLLTVNTLPLLDYKLGHLHEEFRKLFLACLVGIEPKEATQQADKEVSEVSEEHLQIFMLMAAGYKLDTDLQLGLHTYFNQNMELHALHALEQDIIQLGLIDNCNVSGKGRSLIDERKLKSFIKVLEGGKRIDEW